MFVALESHTQVAVIKYLGKKYQILNVGELVQDWGT